MKYAIIIEPTSTGFSAYCPDLPGCVATGPSKQKVESNMAEAISFHLDGLKEDGQPIPPPVSEAYSLEVSA